MKHTPPAPSPAVLPRVGVIGLTFARRLALALTVVAALVAPLAAAGRHTAYQAALDSIAAAELGRTVEDLTGPAFEGREAGTPGGHAAGEYLAEQFRKLPLKPAAAKDHFFQSFGRNYRNILAMLPGSDPQLKEEVVVVAAHYDHVGKGRLHYGSLPGSYYPGADDNASGVAGATQLARAFSTLPAAPRRSLLFLLTDAEEKGMLGSKHWTAEPTLPMARVKFMLNFDMIGSLRADRLLIFGSRSAVGLRRLASTCNQECDLAIDFSWMLKANADHYAFYAKGVPTLFLHTDLHDRYHRTTDTAEKLNRDGMARVARLAFIVLHEIAEGPLPPRFRPAAKAENEDGRRRLEAPEPGTSGTDDSPMRLGIAWRNDDAEPGTAVVSHVAAESPAAAAGLRVGDRIYRVGGRDFADDRAFVQLARTLPGPLELLVERDGRLKTITLHFPKERGKNKRTV